MKTVSEATKGPAAELLASVLAQMWELPMPDEITIREVTEAAPIRVESEVIVRWQHEGPVLGASR